MARAEQQAMVHGNERRFHIQAVIYYLTDSDALLLSK